MEVAYIAEDFHGAIPQAPELYIQTYALEVRSAMLTNWTYCDHKLLPSSKVLSKTSIFHVPNKIDLGIYIYIWVECRAVTLTSSMTWTNMIS